MTQTGGRTDHVEQTADLRERVRLLEVTHQSATLVPRPFRPDRSDERIIADFLALMSVCDSYASVPPQTVGPAAMFLYEQMLTQGFPSTAIAQEWTNFLWRAQLLPEPLSASPLGISKVTPTFTGLVEGGYWSGRIVEWAGLPVGQWTFVDDDVRFGVNLVQIPDLSSLPVWGGDPVTGPFAIRPGSLWLTGLVNGIIARNNWWGFNAFDCGGPDEPAYTASRQPGMPFMYDSGDSPCPDSPGAVFHGGSIMRVQTALPAQDLYLVRPPSPWTPTVTQGAPVNQHDFAPDLPTPEALTALAAEMLPSYPSIQGFLAEWLPIATSLTSQERHFNWQALRVFLGWYGAVQAHRRHNTVLLRGELMTSYPPGLVDLQQSVMVRVAPNLPVRGGLGLPAFPARCTLEWPGGSHEFLCQVFATQLASPEGDTILNLNSVHADSVRAAVAPTNEAVALRVRFDGLTLPLYG